MRWRSVDRDPGRTQAAVMAALVVLASLATALVVATGARQLDTSPGQRTTPYLAAQPSGPVRVPGADSTVDHRNPDPVAEPPTRGDSPRTAERAPARAAPPTPREERARAPEQPPRTPEAETPPPTPPRVVEPPREPCRAWFTRNRYGRCVLQTPTLPPFPTLPRRR